MAAQEFLMSFLVGLVLGGVVGYYFAITLIALGNSKRKKTTKERVRNEIKLKNTDSDVVCVNRLCTRSAS